MSRVVSQYQAAHLPVWLPPRSHFDPDFSARSPTPRDQLLATLITFRWSTQRRGLASILRISQPVLARVSRSQPRHGQNDDDLEAQLTGLV